ncbi:MAG: diaminopimelate epimerase [Clostridia bacterium]|nr:diaminopimelate epimerase [Clostridia bacterium]
MNFFKVHGLGNDFILIDARELPSHDWAALAKKCCDRHTGIGADGILLVQNSSVADTRMRIFNSDGSEAEMCGNGIRCFARYVYERGIVSGKIFSVETLAGLMMPEIVERDGKFFGVRVDMGEPKLDCEDIPVTGSGRCVNRELEVLGKKLNFTSVLMGVPHTYVYVDEIDPRAVETLGAAIECAEAFPRRTNVNFVRVIDRNKIEMRTFERGCGPTLACGTGASGAAVANVLTGRGQGEIDVLLKLGSLHTEWAENNHVYMTGPAEFVFEGKMEGETK